MNQQLTIGRIVHVYVDGRSNNGSDLAPAIITRTWGDGVLDEQHPYIAVNWRLLLDHSSNDPATQEWRTSVNVFPDKASADAFLDYTAEQQYGVKADDGAIDQAKKTEFIRGRKAAGSVGWMPARV